jgi:hypothetical protein
MSQIRYQLNSISFDLFLIDSSIPTISLKTHLLLFSVAITRNIDIHQFSEKGQVYAPNHSTEAIPFP